jgi:hypothetical protein
MRQNRKESFLQKIKKWCSRISDFLVCKSLASLALSGILISWVLFGSWLQGDWPFQYWNNWSLNHGPWRYDFGLVPNPRRYTLSYAFNLLDWSIRISFVSTVLKLSRFTIGVLAGCSIAFSLALIYLYWLID